MSDWSPARPGVQAWYRIRVDYGDTVDEMLRRARFDHAPEPLLDGRRFSVAGEGVHQLEVALFQPAMSRQAAAEIREDMAAVGLEPARAEHLLALASQHPAVQAGPSPITALEAWVHDPGSSRRSSVLSLHSMGYPEEPTRDLGTDGIARPFSWWMLAVRTEDVAALPTPPWPPEASSRARAPQRPHTRESADPDGDDRPVAGIGSVVPRPMDLPTFSELLGWTERKADPLFSALDQTKPGRAGTAYQPYVYGKPPAPSWVVPQVIASRTSLQDRLDAGFLDDMTFLQLVHAVAGGHRPWGPIFAIRRLADPPGSAASFAVATLPSMDVPAHIFVLDLFADRVEIPEIREAVHPALHPVPPEWIIPYRIPIEEDPQAMVEPTKRAVYMAFANHDRSLAFVVPGAAIGSAPPGQRDELPQLQEKQRAMWRKSGLLPGELRPRRGVPATGMYRLMRLQAVLVAVMLMAIAAAYLASC